MQQKNIPSDKLTITVLNNSYTTEISIGKITDFAKNKAHMKEQEANSKLETGIPSMVVVPSPDGTLRTVPSRGTGKLI